MDEIRVLDEIQSVVLRACIGSPFLDFLYILDFFQIT
jgi:hypothetical protein